MNNQSKKPLIFAFMLVADGVHCREGTIFLQDNNIK